MKKYKRLIEVALPIKEISAASVRDKSIRHGHISTLHLWWARRPLPVCRAVVFASLVPDPSDDRCPEEFKKAIDLLLAGDIYKRTNKDGNLGQTSRRERLLRFIGGFSHKYQECSKLGKKCPPKNQLSDFSLIKWENRLNEEVLNKARKLLWVSHDPKNNTLEAFDEAWGKIKKAENDLYGIVDRHQNNPEVELAQEQLNNAIESFQNRMPAVFDPFTGGGAIPLEAARLGCRSYGNDINPVAHIIQLGSVVYPQKYGKPITYTKNAFIEKYGEELLPSKSELKLNNGMIKIPNRLAFDVDYYARLLLKRAEEKVGHYYPADENGKKPIAYYWARVATCGNPSCKAEVPLLKQFYLCNKPKKKFYLMPHINGIEISFTIEEGEYEGLEGWNYRGNLKCPCCGQTTGVKDVKEQFKKKTVFEKLLAVIDNGNSGKIYRLPRLNEKEVLDTISNEIESPKESMEVGNNRNFNTPGWGIDKFGQMFSKRQLLAIQTLIDELNKIKKEINLKDEYYKSVVTYLGILIDRLSIVNTSFGRWHVSGEKIEHPFSRQAIPMMFDYPESHLFCKSSGGAYNQLSWIARYIESESKGLFPVNIKNASSGDTSQFPEKYLSTTVTDPPYYDAIAYADLSDFFYVWLKQTLGDIYPLNFLTPQTPKKEECTALKHHHNNKADQAKEHFENKMLQIFQAVEKQTDGIISIMFAHQSTEAWTTLINSVLRANMNLTGSWAIDTELGNRMISLGTAALASSVTIACHPVKQEPFGDFSEIKKEIKVEIQKQVKNLFELGFRGADLLTACFGQAVGTFGKYEVVERADGTEVEVSELLEMARDYAFEAIVTDIQADDTTQFYIGWLNLFGTGEAPHDHVRRVTQIGLNLNLDHLISEKILIQNKNKERLGLLEDRITEEKNKRGKLKNDPLIDQIHYGLSLYESTDRDALLKFVKIHAGTEKQLFWKVLNALNEFLPPESKDAHLASGMLEDMSNLIRESQKLEQNKKQRTDEEDKRVTQLSMDFE